jgi:hypothetical protein
MKFIVFAWVLLILIAASRNCYGAELENVNLYGGGWSIHSNGTGMNEMHHIRGGCINHACYINFITSFNKPGAFLFYDMQFIEKKYFVFGGRSGFVWGYGEPSDKKSVLTRLVNQDQEPIILPIMPYIGLGYKYFFAEFSYIPAPDGSANYLAITVLRLNIQDKDW